jgi:hypothetical protein
MSTMRATFGQLDGIAEALAESERDVQDQVRLVLEYIGTQTIAFLRSYTSKTRPPIRQGDPPRRRHPGEWADRSGQLAASYGWEVERLPQGWVLHLTNTAEYAVALEQRDGYYVLSGVADRGGPVEAALRRAIAIVAPDWQVVVYE